MQRMPWVRGFGRRDARPLGLWGVGLIVSRRVRGNPQVATYARGASDDAGHQTQPYYCWVSGLVTDQATGHTELSGALADRTAIRSRRRTGTPRHRCDDSIGMCTARAAKMEIRLTMESRVGMGCCWRTVPGECRFCARTRGADGQRKVDNVGIERLFLRYWRRSGR